MSSAYITHTSSTYECPLVKLARNIYRVITMEALTDLLGAGNMRFFRTVCLVWQKTVEAQYIP